ncbi:MAG TPA: hypothetical protein VK280_08850 [Streptosporangiaceae bacterium]|nr:hypothetical protein [Streptosporangiaceae bacterium]
MIEAEKPDHMLPSPPAFGAQEPARVPGPDGTSIGPAEVRIGDSAVLMFDAA